MTISAGGSAEPCATAAKAPIFNSLSLSVEWTSHCEAGLLAHGRGALAEDGGSEDVAGLVDEGAGEVLRSREDQASGEAVLISWSSPSSSRAMTVRRGAEVLAVALVDVEVELGERGALDQGPGDEVAGQGVEVLVGEGMVLGEGDGEVADAAGLGEAHGDSGALADLVDGERLGFAQADDEQPFGFEPSGVQQQGLVDGGFELAAGNPGAVACAMASDVDSKRRAHRVLPMEMSTAKMVSNGVWKAVGSRKCVEFTVLIVPRAWPRLLAVFFEMYRSYFLHRVCQSSSFLSWASGFRAQDGGITLEHAMRA